MKQWYTSKTMWVNFIALLALFAQSQFGFVIDAEAQAAILVVINLILRAVTGSPVEFAGKTFAK